MNEKSFLISGLLVLSLFLMAFSCASDDDNSIDNSVMIEEAINAAKSGTWQITSYIDSDKNETNDYAGYDFTFGDNGLLTASNGSSTFMGVWSVTEDNSLDDSNDNDVDFNISFPAPPSFEELSDDWDIVSVSTTKIDLIDVSGGDGGTDTLTFEKK